jgi:hypothetical protein
MIPMQAGPTVRTRMPADGQAFAHQHTAARPPGELARAPPRHQVRLTRARGARWPAHVCHRAHTCFTSRPPRTRYRVRVVHDFRCESKALLRGWCCPRQAGGGRPGAETPGHAPTASMPAALWPSMAAHLRAPAAYGCEGGGYRAPALQRRARPRHRRPPAKSSPRHAAVGLRSLPPPSIMRLESAATADYVEEMRPVIDPRQTPEACS